MQIQSGMLCNVIGSLETGRVIGVEPGGDKHDQPVTLVHVEFTNCHEWFTSAEITRCWALPDVRGEPLNRVVSTNGIDGWLRQEDGE